MLVEVLHTKTFWIAFSLLVALILYRREIAAFLKRHKDPLIEATATGWLYGLVGWILFSFALRFFFGRGELRTFLACVLTATYTVFVVRVTHREKQVP
jgi:drug/metabolite transporter (DMT)-like permease